MPRSPHRSSRPTPPATSRLEASSTASWLGSHHAPLLAALLLALAVLAAYAITLRAPFVFDDLPSIRDNPTITDLARLGTVLHPPDNGSSVTGRPLINLTLALNYAIGGLSPVGYHAVNVLLHAATALILFGLIRRTLLLRPAPSPALVTTPGHPSPTSALATPSSTRLARAPTAASALSLAFVATLLWALHPLQTESVACVIQRTEVLVSLCYLLTLYAFVRLVGASSPASARAWTAISIGACWLGMGSKELMVSAPLAVFLFDRTFVAGSFTAVWRQRDKFYFGLATAWVPLAWLVSQASGGRGGAAGFGLGVTPWSYLLKQCEALVHYLRLVVWPDPLVLDYGTDVIHQPLSVLPQALLLLAFFALTLFALRRWPRAGFAAIVFFAVLAPSSSFIPLVAQTMAEHRMYLPLASLTVLVTLAAHTLGGLRALAGLTVAALALGAVTVSRNRLYQDEIALWTHTITHRPGNARAHASLGTALLGHNRIDEAITELTTAERLAPEYTDAHMNLATALLMQGRTAPAIAELEKLLRLAPTSPDGQSTLGLALLSAGRPAEAIAHSREAARLAPASSDIRYNLASVLLHTGHLPEARVELETTLHLNPADGHAHLDLGNLLLPNDRPAALAHLEQAARLLPNLPAAQSALAQARAN